MGRGDGRAPGVERLEGRAGPPSPSVGSAYLLPGTCLHVPVGLWMTLLCREPPAVVPAGGDSASGGCPGHLPPAGHPPPPTNQATRHSPAHTCPAPAWPPPSLLLPHCQGFWPVKLPSAPSPPAASPALPSGGPAPAPRDSPVPSGQGSRFTIDPLSCPLQFRPSRVSSLAIAARVGGQTEGVVPQGHLP